ncbi:DUF1841 family protein [Legionella dresdenensis]|uniref:DUF1841 family protein n=1 Tax=Legionella dresdenensis TaxID=450200 RepID=A0ABV8CD84_9GAMM
MFYGDQVQDTRQMFFGSWRKYLAKQPLTQLEQQIVDVIICHPEYHAMFNHEEQLVEQAYFPELGQVNPFLHLGLHLAVRDQISLDRPAGIKKIYRQLSKKKGDGLTAEHLMMDCLAECLWQAQRDRTVPNEDNYLTYLTNLIKG